MAPFSTFFSFLILVVPFAVAIPRYTTETLEASTYGGGEKGPELQAEALDAQVTFDEPVTITVTVEAVTDSGPGHFSSVSADAHSTSPEANVLPSGDAKCSPIPDSQVGRCWRYCGNDAKWCWLGRPCRYNYQCDPKGSCAGRCEARRVPGLKEPDFGVENPRLLVKLLIAQT